MFLQTSIFFIINKIIINKWCWFRVDQKLFFHICIVSLKLKKKNFPWNMEKLLRQSLLKTYQHDSHTDAIKTNFKFCKSVQNFWLNLYQKSTYFHYQMRVSMEDSSYRNRCSRFWETIDEKSNFGIHAYTHIFLNFYETSKSDFLSENNFFLLEVLNWLSTYKTQTVLESFKICLKFFCKTCIQVF